MRNEKAGRRLKACVRSVSLGHGFPWANIPHVGARMVVITDDDKDLGDQLAEELGRRLWTLRNEVVPQVVELDDAIEQSLAIDATPVVFGDIADNPGGGAAGDSTFIARALIERGITDAAVGGIWDPIAVEICHGAGVGAKLDLRLGGKAGRWSGEPLDLHVTVTGSFDDVLAEGLAGSARPMGRTVTLQANGIDYVVHSARTQNFNPSFFAGGDHIAFHSYTHVQV